MHNAFLEVSSICIMKAKGVGCMEEEQALKRPCSTSVFDLRDGGVGMDRVGAQVEHRWHPTEEWSDSATAMSYDPSI